MLKMRKLISALMCGVILLSTFSLSACSFKKNSSNVFEYLKSDISDILVGESTNVVFFAKVSSGTNVKEILVKSDDGSNAATLKDDGNEPDISPSDGIFSGTATLISDVEKYQNYYAIAGANKSDAYSIFFYTKLTEKDYNDYTSVVNGTMEIGNRYANADGYVDSVNIEPLLTEIISYAEEQIKSGNVREYNRESGSVYFKLASGVVYLFSPAQEDVLSSGEAKSVTTIEPFASSAISVSSKINAYLNSKISKSDYQGSYGVPESAKMITSEFDEYTYTNKYANKEVTVDSVKNWSANSIIIWEGHGGNSDKLGSILATGERVTDYASYTSYSADLKSERLISRGVSGEKESHTYYCITFKFFYTYYKEKSLDGCLIYLGACESGKDLRLCDILKIKGASAVIYCSDDVSPLYEMLMRTYIFYNLVKTNEKGEYNSVAEAMTVAKNAFGQFDINNPNTYIDIYGDGNYRLDRSTTENPTTTENATTAPASNAPNYIIDTKSSNLNIRSDASPTSNSVGEIPKGTKVYISQIKNDWGYLSSNGISGWVTMQYLRPFSESVTDEELETMSKYFVDPLNGNYGGYSGGYLGYDQIDWNNLTPNSVTAIIFSLECSSYLAQLEEISVSVSNDKETYNALYERTYGEYAGSYNLTDINERIKAMYGSNSRPLTSSDFSQFSNTWKYEDGTYAENSFISVAYSQDYQSVLTFCNEITGWEHFTPTYITEIKADGNIVSLFNRTYDAGEVNDDVYELYDDSTFIQAESFARQYYYDGLKNNLTTLENEAEYIFTRNTDGGVYLKSVRKISS